MSNLQTKHVVAEIYEHMIGPDSRDIFTVNGVSDTEHRSLRNGTYALYFKVAVDLSNHGYEKDGNTYHKGWERHYRSTVHVMLTQRHNIFVCNTFGRTPPTLGLWINSSNHDSCWKDDGLRIFDEVLWEAYEHCYDHMPEEHKPCLNMTSPWIQFENWYCGRSPFEIVKLKGEYNQGDDYRWSLTEMKQLKHTFNVVDDDHVQSI